MISPQILSGKKPLFKKNVYVTRPNLPTKRELNPLITEMLSNQWVTNFGNFHKEFEEKIKGLLKVKYAVLCCNGTVALFLLLKALNLKGKVITTPFTFPATVHSIFMAGLEPLFCDINPHDYTIDAESVKINITNDTSCILGVNVFGNTCDIENLNVIGKKFGIPVIYDSAHAFLCRYKNKPVGGFGDAEMFSFHATKLFTTIEGGAITTNDEHLYIKLRQLINFGIKNEESVVGIGLNGKMSEINAIFGLLSLKKINKIIGKLKDLSESYNDCLSGIPGIKFQKIRKDCQINHQYMPVEIIPEEFGLNRNTLHLVLKKDNIFTRKYFYPSAHQYECYKDFHFTKNVQLPNTETVASQILCLPIYADLKTEEVEKICDLIKSAYYNVPLILKKFKKINNQIKNEKTNFK